MASLLAVQAAGDPLDPRGRAMHRADGIRDVLDGLKLALLEGRSMSGRLTELAAATARARETTDDPRLEAILDEVEIRAAVELAKHAAV